MIVTIIHFNDCYNIEPSKSSSGAAGFVTAINKFRHLEPMILFSGDILSPSFMSTFTKGEQMIPVLNKIGVDCAVFGNHEFDYGVDNLIDFAKRTNFPWLLSNAIDKETSNQLGDGLVYHIMERCNLKFGLIGLIEQEWLSTLSTLEIDDIVYEDFVERGRELAIWLKKEHKVDYVIALTHFRTPNDIKLSDSVPEIDLILGGHDHEYEITKRDNSYIVKSGTDFREFSKISLKVNEEYLEQKKQQELINNENEPLTLNATTTAINSNGNSNNKVNFTGVANSALDANLQSFPIVDIKIERVACIGYEEDAELKKQLEKYQTSIDSKMSQVLGQFNCDLDGRFSSIRKSETNLGNFVTDIMLASTHADLAILNSGTLRSDRVHYKGDFTMRDLFNILGYIDPIAVLKATGWHVWQALENGVSAWPKLEGRFPQVSGCSFAFDPSKPAMKRINPKDISIGDEQLDLNKEYKLTTKAYLASGKDGYDMLKDCEVLVPGDESPDLTTSILNHFESIKILKSKRRTHHRQSVICLSRSTLKKIYEGTGQSPATTPTTTTTTTLSATAPETLEMELENVSTNNHCIVDTPILANKLNKPISNNNQSSNNENNNISSSTIITTNTNNTQNTNAIANQTKTMENQTRLKNESASINTGAKADKSCPQSSEHLPLKLANGNNVTAANNNHDLESTQTDISTNNASTYNCTDCQNKQTPALATSQRQNSLSPNSTPHSIDNPLLNSSDLLESAASATSSPQSITSLRRLKRITSLSDFELEMCKLEPKTEGRIRILTYNSNGELSPNDLLLSR